VVVGRVCGVGGYGYTLALLALLRHLRRKGSVGGFDHRVVRLLAALRKRRMDAYLCVRLSNIRYLTGFTGSNAALVVFRRGEPVLFTDGRYTEQARSEVRGADVMVTPDPWSAVARRIRALRARRVGFESAISPWIPSGRSPGVERIVSSRPGPRRDSPDEEGARGDSRDGARDGDRDRVPAIRPRLRSPGESGARRGRGPGAEMVRRERRGSPFPDRRGRPTLRDAPRDPGRGGDRGDGPLVLDFGARWNGYCSDETVTILPRRPRSPLGNAFDAVRRAQAAGISSVRPGEPCRGVDARVRDSLDRSGYLKYFVHSTGHGRRARRS